MAEYDSASHLTFLAQTPLKPLISCMLLTLAMCFADCIRQMCGDVLMNTELKTLWQRERRRRDALWALARLRPGVDEAKSHLASLDDIDHQDRSSPIGDAGSMTIEELREFVLETLLEGADGYSFVLVLDQHIPQPWRTRFEAASMLSTRLHEGAYARDWRRFLRLWQLEMEHLAAHRESTQNK